MVLLTVIQNGNNMKTFDINFDEGLPVKIILDLLSEQAKRRKILIFQEPGELGTVAPLADNLFLPIEALSLTETGSYAISENEEGDELDLEILPSLGLAIIDAENEKELQDNKEIIAVLDDQVIGIPEELEEEPVYAMNSGMISPARRNNLLSSALQQVGIHPNYPLTGENVAIAIIDTGLDTTHPDFVNRINLNDFRDFTATSSITPIDDHGHGTHCAGIIGGPRNANGGYGVAPAARLIIGRVLSKKGPVAFGLLSDALRAAQWAVSRGARIISMSLGVRTIPGAPFDASLVWLAQNLYDRGVILVAASGNDSNRSSIPPYTVAIRQPAAWGMPPVISVGALDGNNNVAPFSNGGSNMVIAAPGVDIYSSWPVQLGGPYMYASGTSGSCPIVSGLLALDLQRNPQLTPRILVENLKKRAIPLPYLHINDVGAGLVQAP